LETAIRACLDADRKPFRWTKSADDILAAVKGFGPKIREIAAAQTEIARNSESRTLYQPSLTQTHEGVLESAKL
jgi:hypothetical protein